MIQSVGVFSQTIKERINWRFGGSIHNGNKIFFAEPGFYIKDFPVSLNRHGEWSEIINHNTFVTTEISLSDKLLLGPRLGYEYNYVLFQGRISMQHYFNTCKENQTVIRPEAGLTLFGIATISYGYNIDIITSKEQLVQAHVISFNYNIW